jgi:hypothetical protein
VQGWYRKPVTLTLVTILVLRYPSQQCRPAPGKHYPEPLGMPGSTTGGPAPKELDLGWGLVFAPNQLVHSKPQFPHPTHAGRRSRALRGPAGPAPGGGAGSGHVEGIRPGAAPRPRALALRPLAIWRPPRARYGIATRRHAGTGEVGAAAGTWGRQLAAPPAPGPLCTRLDPQQQQQQQRGLERRRQQRHHGSVFYGRAGKWAPSPRAKFEEVPGHSLPSSPPSVAGVLGLGSGARSGSMSWSFVPSWAAPPAARSSERGELGSPGWPTLRIPGWSCPHSCPTPWQESGEDLGSPQPPSAGYPRVLQGWKAQITANGVNGQPPSSPLYFCE